MENWQRYSYVEYSKKPYIYYFGKKIQPINNNQNKLNIINSLFFNNK